MNKILPLFLALIVLVLTSSCSDKIVGTWNVDTYESKKPGQDGVLLRNIGTITFLRNGEGRKDVNYSIFNSQRADRSPFSWTASKQGVTILGYDSDLAKAWIRVENKNKVQKLQSTDGNDEIQTLLLKK